MAIKEEITKKLMGKLVNVEEDIWVRVNHIEITTEETIYHLDGSISPAHDIVSISDNGSGWFGYYGREAIKEA